jgi:Chaperone of endosialidase
VSALLNHRNNDYNNAVGTRALERDTSGYANNAFGDQALINNTIGNNNTAIGDDALLSNTSASNSTALGSQALYHSTGGNNIAVGRAAGINLTTGTYNIDIGNPAASTDTRTIRIGHPANQFATFIAGIRGRATGVANGLPVLIDSNGQLGTASSSRRFKKEIKPMDQTSEAILSLKPVTFHYKSDNTGPPQFGLIAEDVAKANPDLVVRDENGEIYTVRYDAVNAMLLNEFLKEHRKVQELQANAARMQKQIDGLTAGLQRVSAQLEMSKSLPHTVLNNQ